MNSNRQGMPFRGTSTLSMNDDGNGGPVLAELKNTDSAERDIALTDDEEHGNGSQAPSVTAEQTFHSANLDHGVDILDKHHGRSAALSLHRLPDPEGMATIRNGLTTRISFSDVKVRSLLY